MPSTALADFVRCRDLTCRFPGCDHPAIDCDLDHTIPYAQGGPTHAGNLKCYCRTHQLLSLFGRPCLADSGKHTDLSQHGRHVHIDLLA